MKTTVQKRLARLAGLLLLSLLVAAIGVRAAQAATVSGTGAGSSTVSLTPTTQLQALTAAQRHHYFGGNDNGRFQPVSNVLAAQPASSSASSTTVWIAAGTAAALAIVVIAAWALIRRQRPGQLASASYCAQHPEDSLCIAA